MAYDAPAALDAMSAGAAVTVAVGGDLASAGGGATAVAFVAGTLDDGRVVLFIKP